MERNSYHYPTEKRSGAFDPGSGLGSSKRVKTHHTQLLPPLVVPVGHAAFRLLCPLSHVGAVIGKSGSVIKQLQQSTGAKIRVEEPPFGSPDRVITIIAQVDSKSRVNLGVNNNGNAEAEKKEEEVEVSKAQGALIRVFELLAAEADSDTVVCRLLTESSHAGAVIGKGGQMVESIRKETGCKIAIRTENLPICADTDDEMVEVRIQIDTKMQQFAKLSSLNFASLLVSLESSCPFPILGIGLQFYQSLEHFYSPNRNYEHLFGERFELKRWFSTL